MKVWPHIDDNENDDVGSVTVDLHSQEDREAID